MRHFSLNIEPFLQGKFHIKEINFAFIFQVNCSGCFLYGIPLVNELYIKSTNTIGFVGVSTAFEDFDFNTEINTKQLLYNGRLVGQTKKHYSENFGTEKYDREINFPVAFDKLKEPDQFLTDSNLTIICNSNPNYSIWPDWEKREMSQKVKSYYKQFPFMAETFTLNQLQGTPTFVIFDKNYNLLKMFFGHQKLEALEAELIKYTN